MTTPTIAKEIVYDRESREYAIYVTIDEGPQLIGFRKTWHDAEMLCNEYAYNYYTDHHTPEVAARIAVEGFGPNPACEQCRACPATWEVREKGGVCSICDTCYRNEFEENPDRHWSAWEANRLPVTVPISAPLAHRSVTVSYDGARCDLVSIAAQVLLPLAHLRPQLNRKGTYLLLMDAARIPAPQGDHAIVVNMIDRLNEVAAQLPERPTSITAWLHVSGEIYQVARNK